MSPQLLHLGPRISGGNPEPKMRSSNKGVYELGLSLRLVECSFV